MEEGDATTATANTPQSLYKRRWVSRRLLLHIHLRGEACEKLAASRRLPSRATLRYATLEREGGREEGGRERKKTHARSFRRRANTARHHCYLRYIC